MAERFIFQQKGRSPKLFIIGDSHTIAIGHGFQARIAENPRFYRGALGIRNLFPGWASSQKFHEHLPGRVVPAQGRMRAGLAAMTGQSYFSKKDQAHLFGFCTGLYLRVLRVQLMHKRTIPAAVRLKTEPADVTLMSEAVFEKIVTSYNAPVLAFFKDLKKLRIPFFVIAPPPGRDDDIHRSPELGEDVHLQIDELCKQVMRKELSKIGVRYVEPPPQCISQTGGLLPEYWDRSEGDFVHANAAYGKLMAECIIKSAMVQNRIKQAKQPSTRFMAAMQKVRSRVGKLALSVKRVFRASTAAGRQTQA